MDINSLINTQSLPAPNRLLENTLNLKVGQQLDVKVINAEIQAAKNAITLSLGGKDVSVQSNQPITLSPGQDLKIQVTQIAPSIEFKVLDPLPELKNQAIELRLKLIPTARDGGNAAPMRPTAKDAGSVATGRLTITEQQDNAASPSSVKQLLDAKIIGIIGNKIQLQVFNPSTANTGNKPVAVITIDRTQLTNAPSDLKIGQSLNLEIVKTGTTPEFKIIPAATHIPEAKVAEFIKQFLPRHEASPIFLNQLIKDLPQLLKNESVPQALKDIAAKIVQNLPPKEQLVTSQGLKLAIVNSGLFLEAKLPPALVQAELIKELPQLIKNESVPQSLQRIAAEILQNLTQKQPLLNNPVLQQLATNTAPIAETELATLKLNLPLTVESESGIAKTNVLGAEDFKANLLKFIHALKQELATQGEQPLNKTDVDLLKNLQNKTENTVAKLVLDQLMSLPKEDSPKQLWVIDIPFIDRQQAETVKIEIQRDKENKKQSGSVDWSVNITITPPGLGTIHCMVSYRNDAINTFFKSQNTQTTELIKHNLDYLKNQLEESGLKTGHMDAHDGAQKTQAAHPHQLAGKKLFDDNA
ncbi:flagellar hook-length control protein FliK [Methylobacter tundripaludum]|uniref:Flagellar hook-length control protein FliK n=1 Tax=Methylobacter tundripaludum TaxID=173365 RepID=A0A2S6HGA1_9GAMM|nr:flagellar hook-length control protein FliK [Methylobacter tundripaludum]PPK76480.1 flagellar hook-length control protein FliK [Methylobacter tundripaludum]